MSVTILLVGAFVAASCSLVGSFLVLRRMALLGDAISHSVLPGIAIAFLISGSKSPLPMVFGAGALGVLTVSLVELLNRSRRLYEDASIGVVFPALFSIGVLLISAYASQVDLDLDCVLYGEIALTELDILVIGGEGYGPRALWITGMVLVIDLIFVLCCYKELAITTFDRDLADSLGISSRWMHYLLMSAVSITVVAAFESVGAILVVAMLVVPPATAYLLTERLSLMILLAVGLGVLSSVLGYGGARLLDASIAGCMASVAGGLFLLAVMVSPSNGVLARWVRRHKLRRELAAELVLLHLEADASGTAGTAPTAVGKRFGWPEAELHRVLALLLQRGLAEQSAGSLRMTPAGRRFLEEKGTGILAHRR